MKIRHSTNLSKLFSIILIILLCFSTICFITWWKSPDVNYLVETSIHKCIHNDNSKLHFALEAGGGNNFDIYLVENSKQNCLNPYFPSIHIQASQSHNAWIHIVYIDAKTAQWRTFIDAASKDRKAYPFYTYEQDFYDAPLWTYSLFNKPLSFWKGHAFAVEIDHQKKRINCIGGIEWGFELPQFKLRPKAIHPQLLGKQDWEQAWRMLRAQLPSYRQTYGGNL